MAIKFDKHVRKYNFNKTKYGQELLIDLIRLEKLEKYIRKDPSHVLNYYDITLITKGIGYFSLDESRYAIEPDKIFFSTPMQFRKWEFDEIPEGLVLIFEEDFLCTFFNDSQFVQKLSYFNTMLYEPVLEVKGHDLDYFKKILVNIEEEIVSHEEKDNHILRALLYQVLVWLNRQYHNSHAIPEQEFNNYVFEFKKLVNKYYINQHGVAFYADSLNITAGHLNDMVKETIGISAKQYILDRIFLEAKRLLQYSPLSISEIAWKLHFQDDSYFIRAFKNQTGCTPQKYRNKKNP